MVGRRLAVVGPGAADRAGAARQAADGAAAAPGRAFDMVDAGRRIEIGKPDALRPDLRPVLRQKRKRPPGRSSGRACRRRSRRDCPAPVASGSGSVSAVSRAPRKVCHRPNSGWITRLIGERWPAPARTAHCWIGGQGGAHGVDELGVQRVGRGAQIAGDPAVQRMARRHVRPAGPERAPQVVAGIARSARPCRPLGRRRAPVRRLPEQDGTRRAGTGRCRRAALRSVWSSPVAPSQRSPALRPSGRPLQATRFRLPERRFSARPRSPPARRPPPPGWARRPGPCRAGRLPPCRPAPPSRCAPGRPR